MKIHIRSSLNFGMSLVANPLAIGWYVEDTQAKENCV